MSRLSRFMAAAVTSFGARGLSTGIIALMAWVGLAPLAPATAQGVVDSINIRVGSSTTDQLNATATEGTQTATVVVKLKEPLAQARTTFNLALGGTASNGTDYMIPEPRSIEISQGQQTGSITINIVDDKIDEASETITFAFGTAPTATLTIADNDDRPAIESLTASPERATEGTTTNVTVKLKLKSQVSETAQTYPLTFTGTADDSSDYTAATPREITIPAGQDERTYTFQVNNDTTEESDEWIDISTSGADKTSSERVTIVDDDRPSVVSLQVRLGPDLTFGANQTEKEGSFAATVRLTLAENAGADLTFPLTFSGDAVNAEDFKATSPAQITVRAGQKTGDFTFRLLEDEEDEKTETLEIQTGSRSKAETATIVIRDDDAPSILSLVADPDSVAEGSTTVTVTMTLKNATKEEEFYLLRLTGDAIPAVDFNGPDDNAQLVTLNVPNGQTTHKFEVEILGDAIVEPDETIIASVTAAGINGKVPATREIITILDDDDPVPQSLIAEPDNPKEGNTAVVLTLKLDNDTLVETRFPLTFDPKSSAKIDEDFSAPGNREIIIGAGKREGKYTLNILDDAIDEGNEEINVKVGSGTAERSETITIVDDDTLSVMAIDATPAEVTENGEVVNVVVRFGTKAADERILPVTYTGTATPNDDYTGGPAQITVPAGAASVQFQLRTRRDDVVEGNETIILGVLTRTATVTILDLDEEVAALDEVRQQAGAALLRRNAKRFAFVTNNVVTKRLNNESANALSSDGRQAFVDVGASVSSVAAALRPGAAGGSGGSAIDRPVNAWVSVEATRLKGDVDGDVFDIHFGADYKIGRDALIGVVASYEQADVTTELHDGGLKADGWSLGAYAGVQLLPELTWDIAGSYGRQSPDVYARAGTQSFFGSYDSNRLLVSSHLTGRLDAGDGVVVKPTVGLLYGRDEQGTLTGSRGGTASGRVLELGRVSAGPGFDLTPTLPTGWGAMNITFSAVGQYDFLAPEADNVGTKKDKLSAAAALGVAWTDQNGMSIGVDGSIDGIGLEGYDAYNVSGTLKFDF